MELISAVAILTVLLTLCLQMLGRSGLTATRGGGTTSGRCGGDQRAGRVTARPWDELEAEKPQLSPAAHALLPAAELKIAVAVAPDEPDAKLITVSLRWQDRNGLPVRPVCLSAWRYRQEKKTATDEHR